MAKKRDSMFSDKKFLGELFKIALPVGFQNLMLAMVAAADAVMLGRIDQNAMSAVSLATQIQFLQNMVIYAFVLGVSVLAAQYWGKGDKKTVQDIFCTGLRVNAAISIITFLGCELCPGFLMTIFTNESVLVEIGVKYLKIAGWSYLLTGISQCYLCMLKVENRAKYTAIISTTVVIINIFFNAIFIFGIGGAPRLEERGAAVATLISRVVEVIWCIALSYKKDFLHPDFRRIFKFNKVISKDFAKCVLPLLASSCLWGIGFTSYSAFMGHLGTDAAAANSVAAVVRDLVCCLCNGLASGGGIIVGYALGRGDLETGKLYGDRVTKLGFVCGFASTVIMLAVTPLLLAIVNLTEGARNLLLGMMVIMAFYMIGRSVNTIVINGIFDAGGDTLFDAYSLAVTMWCMAVPLAALGTFVFGWHPLVVYAMTCLDEVGKIPWVMIHYRKYKWVKDLTKSKKELET